MFYIQFFYWKNERIAHFLFFGERCEWIAQVAHQKWAMWANRLGRSPKMSDHERFALVAQRKWVIVRELLRSLTKNERICESLIFWANRSFAHFWAKNKRFARKSDERIPSPAFFAFLLHESNPLGPLISRLKWFCWKIAFCRHIWIKKVKQSCDTAILISCPDRCDWFMKRNVKNLVTLPL